MSEPHPVILPPLEPPPGGLVLFSPAQWRWVTNSLRAIYLAQDITLRALGPLTEGTETIMATVAELQAELDANTALTETAVAAITAEIAQLQAAIDALANAAPSDLQPQVDQVKAANARLQTAVDALNADDAPVEPTP